MKVIKLFILLFSYLCSINTFALNNDAINKIKNISKKNYSFNNDEFVDLKIDYKHLFDINNEKDYLSILNLIGLYLNLNIKKENINIAIVVKKRNIKNLIKGNDNNEIDLLLDSGLVKIYIPYQALKNTEIDLKENVEISYSSMTAHYNLQQKGFIYSPIPY